MITISGLEAKKYRITLGGMKELEQQLQDLKAQQPEVAEEISDMSSQSTVSVTNSIEESGLALERNRATEIEDQIALLERIIAMAEIVEPPTDFSTVQVGTTVSAVIAGNTIEFGIVGPVEADPSEGKISDESPLGQSIIGKKVGDEVEIDSPSGKSQAIIKSIK